MQNSAVTLAPAFTAVHAGEQGRLQKVWGRSSLMSRMLGLSAIDVGQNTWTW